jgi:TP53 regulating kinase-like protein
MKGAEAVLIAARIINRDALIKSRIPKAYRIKELDEKLRTERTRMEARLLNKAKLAGVSCPTVLEVGAFDITMGRLPGRRPEMDETRCKEAGALLAKLHAADIIHGDFTPANLLCDGKTLYVIDFGLGYISNDIEDKAVDVFTMLRAIETKGGKDAFVSGYKAYQKAKQVLARVAIVEKRVRYAF